jgi:hypothetical protein
VRTTNERLLEALNASDERVKEASRLTNGNTELSEASAAKMAFTTAFSAGAVLVYMAVELPDESGELPHDRQLSGPSDLTPGYVALKLQGKIAEDGTRFFRWCEFEVYDQGLAARPPVRVDRALEWVATIREA